MFTFSVTIFLMIATTVTSMIERVVDISDALKLVLIGIMAAVCKNNHNQRPRIAAKNCIGMVSDRGEGGQ